MIPSEIAAYDSHRDLSSKPFRSACYAGYTSMVFDSIGRVRMCCVNAEYILGDIRHNRLDDIWNGPRIAKMRESLANYDFGLGCGECERKFQSGITEGSNIRDSQFMPFKYERFEIESGPPYWPKHLEFHLSNKCNLQCVTCSGEFSSVIRSKREKLSPYPPAYNDQFFEDLKKYLPHLKEAQFLGGEPFIIPEMFRVWNMLIDAKLTPLCHVTTNGTVFGQDVERILRSLPMSVNVSMDGITRETFESIRVNAKLERVIRNVRRLRDVCRSEGQNICINFTLSRMNWHEFVDLLLFAESEDVDVSSSTVSFPGEMSVLTMEPSELKRVIDRFEEQLDLVGNRLLRTRKLLENRIQELRYHLQQMSGLSKGERELSIVEFFEGAKAGPETMYFSRSRTKELLDSWSLEGTRDEIICDSNNLIVEANLGKNSRFAQASELVGQSFSQFVAMLFERYGSKVVHISNEIDAGHIDRVFRIEDVGQSHLMRVIMTPCFDADGELAGVRATFATKEDEFAAMAPRVPDSN